MGGGEVQSPGQGEPAVAWRFALPQRGRMQPSCCAAMGMLRLLAVLSLASDAVSQRRLPPSSCSRMKWECLHSEVLATGLAMGGHGLRGGIRAIGDSDECAENAFALDSEAIAGCEANADRGTRGESRAPAWVDVMDRRDDRVRFDLGTEASLPANKILRPDRLPY